MQEEQHFHDCPWWFYEPCTCALRTTSSVASALTRPLEEDEPVDPGRHIV